jgi:predicted transcriptional regulator
MFFIIFLRKKAKIKFYEKIIYMMSRYIRNNFGVAAMRGRARVLDSRYLEFIEYLQKLGELQSITRMIANLSYQENEAWERSEGVYEQQEREASKIMYPFWQRGWIEIREIEKKRDNGQAKEYVITISLKMIVEYFGKEKLARSARSKYSLSGQEMPVPA